MSVFCLLETMLSLAARMSTDVGVYCFLPSALKQGEILSSENEFTTGSFLINKPMKLEGNEAALTLKENWGDLAIIES